MPQKADIGGKRLISLDPNNWLKWVMQRDNLQAMEIINSDFQWLSRENDILIRTYSASDHQDFLVLNELQLRYNDKIPRRMRAYAALAEEKYQLPTYPILINILPSGPNQTIVNCYQSDCYGLKARQDYRVINLWEVDVEKVFEQPIPSLLPFVPILKGGGDEFQVRKALAQLRQNKTLDELEPLLAFFATFVLDSPLVQQIMRWDMAVLLESPWYRQILQEGEKVGRTEGRTEGRVEGRVEGRAEGRVEGRAEGLLTGISTILELRFGVEGLQLMSEIQALESIETLESVLVALKTVNSLDELRQIYG